MNEQLLEILNNPPVGWMTIIAFTIASAIIIYHSCRKGPKRIFISGKVSGTNMIETKKKFLDAEQYAWFCLSDETKNFNIINPTRLGLPFKASWLYCMVVCIYNLLKCRSIYMLRDWKDSKGSRTEHWIAKRLRYEIIYQN